MEILLRKRRPDTPSEAGGKIGRSGANMAIKDTFHCAKGSLCVVRVRTCSLIGYRVRVVLQLMLKEL